MKEHPSAWRAAAILVLAGGVALLAFLLDSGAPGAVLTAVIAGATIAYVGVTWLLVDASDQDRRARRTEREEERNAAFRAVLTELRHNIQRYTAKVSERLYLLYERSALDESRRYQLALPEQVRKGLQEVELAISLHTPLADYLNSRAHTMEGVGAGGGGLQATVHDYSTKVYTSCTGAAALLSGHLGLDLEEGEAQYRDNYLSKDESGK